MRSLILKKILPIILFFITIPIFINCNSDVYPYYMMQESIVDPIDALIPCVAVIDEDSSFSSCSGCSDQTTMWNRFRARYPDRPFCLLVVEDGVPTITPPSNFRNDPDTVWYYPVTRDNGDAGLADDWVSLCNLNSYTSEDIPSVGLFVDNSGSMYKSDVIASYNKFINDIGAKGIRVKEVVNMDENWILPFMTVLIK